MDVRQLRYFLGIAECGSLSRAAERLRVAQPALSQHVANLERDLDVKLLKRSSRGVELTEAGTLLLEHARGVLLSIERAREAVRSEAAGDVVGQVCIGLATTAAMVLTVPLLRALSRRHPGIMPHIAESQSGHLQEWLCAGRMDFAILVQDGAATLAAGLAAVELLTEELFLVGPADSAGHGEFATFDEALSRPLLLPNGEHGFRRLLDQTAARHRPGAAWTVVAEVDALPHLRRAVVEGLGWTILPWAALHEDIAAGRVAARRIVAPTIGRTLVMVNLLGRPPTRARDAARVLLLQTVRELVDGGSWPGRLLALQGDASRDTRGI